VLAAAWACCPTSAAWAEPSLSLSERAALPGERVAAVGHGFPARARARLSLAGRTMKRSRVGRRGRVRLRFTVPARTAGRYRLTLRAGRREARRSLRILAPARPATPAPPPPALPPPPPPPVLSTLVAAGDIACRPELMETATQCRHARTAALVESLAPDAVAALGDLQYQYGELVNFQTAYGPTWGRFAALTHPVPGNHEYEGDLERDSAPGYYTYFGAAAGDPALGYYRWDLPGWTLFALNSGALAYTRMQDELPDDCWPVSCAAGSGQETWLRAQLAALPAGRCVLGYWHHPRESSGFGGMNQPHPETEPLVDALRDHGAELILTAHSHNYERFDLGGITQFVVGTGGRHLHTNPGPPLTTTLRTDVFGVLELTLGPASWSSRFVAESGAAIDPASWTC
jgi:calcineurin-like phosphoesterase family protein